jgi:two-component system, sensor histidine kinase
VLRTAVPLPSINAPECTVNLQPEATVQHSNVIRVLLADDTVSVRKVTTHLLQRAGFDVSTATNGVEALDKLSSEVFDVVLMDLHMPVMDGIEAVRRLRAQEAADEAAGADDRRMKSLHTIVIALTANSTAGLSDETKAVGFDAFLEKPLKVKKFQQTLLELYKVKGGGAAPGLDALF